MSRGVPLRSPSERSTVVNPEPVEDLIGRTALVTGAGRGLGRAYALRLARQGADVAIVDLDLRSYREFDREAAQMTADTTTKEVEAFGRRSIGIELDASDAPAIQAAVAEIVKEWGHLDIAVCNAGGGLGTPAESRASTMDASQYAAVVSRNLHGTVHTCQAVAAPMREQRYGRIITVASQAGRVSSPGGGYAHYGTAKAGIIMYTRYLAQDLGPDGITVNCIAPGYIGTGRLMPNFEARGLAGIVDSIALRRLGTPEDCAKVVGFLCGSGADYITGAVIPIDGGSVR
jgi:3-oxoacyl-[acyl-carrier protein] reductase